MEQPERPHRCDNADTNDDAYDRFLALGDIRHINSGSILARTPIRVQTATVPIFWGYHENTSRHDVRRCGWIGLRVWRPSLQTIGHDSE